MWTKLPSALSQWKILTNSKPFGGCLKTPRFTGCIKKHHLWFMIYDIVWFITWCLHNVTHQHEPYFRYQERTITPTLFFGGRDGRAWINSKEPVSTYLWKPEVNHEQGSPRETSHSISLASSLSGSETLCRLKGRPGSGRCLKGQ